MNKNMIASQPLTYGTRRLLPGDAFVASRRDAELLRRLGRATEAPEFQSYAPVDAGRSKPVEQSDDLSALRIQYRDVFGKRPLRGWDADELKAKIDGAKGTN